MTAGLDNTPSRFASVSSVHFVVFLLMIAFLVRLVVTYVAFHGLGFSPSGDEPAYLRLAQSVADGLGFVDAQGNPTSQRPPLLPILLAPMVGAGASTTALRLTMIVLSLSLVLACYTLGLMVADRRTAFAMGVAAAVMPSWVHNSALILTDTLSAALVVAVACVVLRSNHTGSRRGVLAAGLLLGVGALLRPTNVVFLAPVGFWILASWHDRTNALQAAAILIVSALLVIAPWSVRNCRSYGQFVLLSTQGGTELWKSNNLDATGVLEHDHALFKSKGDHLFPRGSFTNEAIRSTLYAADAKRFIISHPRRFVRLALTKFAQFWKIYSPRVSLRDNVASILSFGVILPLFLLRLGQKGWKRGPDMLFALLIGTATAVYCVYGAVVRYRLPIEPFVLAMAVLSVLERSLRLPCEASDNSFVA